MSKKFTDLIPAEEQKAFGIHEEAAPLKITDVLNRIIRNSELFEEEEEEVPAEEVKEQSEKLLEEMNKYLEGEFKSLRDGLAEVAENFSAEDLQSVIEKLEFEEPTWKNKLILDAWGEK